MSTSRVYAKNTRCHKICTITLIDTILFFKTTLAGRPGSSEASRNPLTRWDVSSIPANGIFLTKNLPW